MQPHPHAIQVVAQKQGGTIRRPDAPSRITLHTTETPPGTGMSVIRRLLWPYHFVVEIEGRRIYQLIDMAKSAYSLRGSSYNGGQETNHMGKFHVQVSFVGYAGRMDQLSNSDLKWIAQYVLKPIIKATKTGTAFSRSYGPSDGIVLASTRSRVRMTRPQWEDFHGITYHQIVPGQDHWDMGKVNHRKLREYLDGVSPIEPLTPDPDRIPMTPGLNSTLSIGDEGEETERLQVILNKFFAAGLTEDGEFGPATEAAVMAAQDVLGIETDGFWGPLTARSFDSWKVRLADAVVAGLTNQDEEVIQALIKEQWKSHVAAMDAITTLEKQVADLFSSLGVKDNSESEGILDSVQSTKAAIKAISSARKDIKALVSD